MLGHRRSLDRREQGQAAYERVQAEGRMSVLTSKGLKDLLRDRKNARGQEREYLLELKRALDLGRAAKKKRKRQLREGE